MLLAVGAVGALVDEAPKFNLVTTVRGPVAPGLPSLPTIPLDTTYVSAKE